MRLVTRRTVSASHRLPDHAGKCKQLHGHNWKVRVAIDGDVIREKGNPQNGMMIDFSKVKEAIDELDHRDLNEMFDEEHPPTAENIAAYMGIKLYDLQANITRVVVQIWESDDSYIEWDSDKDLEREGDAFPDWARGNSPLTPYGLEKQREADKDMNGAR